MPSAEEIQYYERVTEIESQLGEPCGYGRHIESMDVEGIVDNVTAYTRSMEKGKTADWCSCLWRFHEDDMNKPEEERRKIKIEEHPFCPVHTKEGLILGFFKWLYRPA